ncbi:MAG TPA: sigma-70 family RNA polymerase sigma factor, partial [Chitinophagaceae bacterium]|nr:sigma-70 family RNA polymerase sigma factor [Chitinophagaceae bacterium]
MSMRHLKISKSITTRDSISLTKYMQEIGKEKMINPDEEVFLCQQIRMGNAHAFEKMIKVNLRFVVSVAKQYQGQGLPLCDLVNEGNIGLMHAVRKFDESRGFKFISFAVWWIRQEIVRAISQKAMMVRVPLNKSLLRNKVRLTSSMLEQQLDRSPSEDELAAAMNISTEEISEIMSLSQNHVSLDSPLDKDAEESCLLDKLEDINAVKADTGLQHEASLKTEIGRHLKILTDRQKETICCFFGLGGERALSLEDIARKFELTTERVRQIKD